MRNSKGELKSDWQSVSKVMKYFYEEFDSEGISLRKAKGNLEVQQQIYEKSVCRFCSAVATKSTLPEEDRGLDHEQKTEYSALACS